MAGARAAQRDATRQALVEKASALFADRGYEAVALSEVVHAAGVTKGALYHHFTGKRELFIAVLADTQLRVGAAVQDAAQRHEDAWTGLVAGCHAFLDACTASDVRQVLLVDGPAVVDWDTWRALDEQGAAHQLREALAGLMGHGVLPAQPGEPVTRALSGAMNELALWLHDASPAHSGQAHDVLDALLEVLRRSEVGSPTSEE